MDTDTLRRDLDAFHTDPRRETDRFTSLVIFASDHDFPAFAAKHGIGYKPVMGLYQGLIEESFVINHKDGAALFTGGILVGQDSVLLLSPQESVYGGNREVWLSTVAPSGSFLSPHPEFLGLWHKVSIDEALHCDAWTCYSEDNAWYVTKMPETYLKPACDTLSQ